MLLNLRPLALDGVLEFRPKRHSDARGFFSETWSRRAMAEVGLDYDFVQDNHSFSAANGVLRGLHFQTPPLAQDKLVRVSRGSVFDVAVDIREGSPTFGGWTGLVLSAALWNQIWIPKGFAHGFVTLEPNTEVQYKVTARYDPAYECCIKFDDPTIGIEWPVSRNEIQVSDRDREAPLLSLTDSGFRYEHGE